MRRGGDIKNMIRNTEVFMFYLGLVCRLPSSQLHDALKFVYMTLILTLSGWPNPMARTVPQSESLSSTDG